MPTKAQHSPFYDAFRRRLRVIREEAGLTQRELGAMLGKPQSWIYNCETGNRRVDVAEFVLWSHACSVKPSMLINDVSETARFKRRMQKK